jgi:hypothetical protein
MHECQSLSHVRWDCRYHVVIIPKYRRKVFGQQGAAPLIVVDDQDAGSRSPELHRPTLELVLQVGRLAVLGHLMR